MSIRPNTTCDIYRFGNGPPATPDVAAVPCCFISCFDVGRERGEKEALQFRFTARMLVAPDTDVRDNFNAWTGSGTSCDSVYIPDQTATGYNVVFVERINRGLPSDALCVYLDRLPIIWPYPGPAIFSITPNNGGTLGGTSVVVTGRGFTGASTVLFGSTAAGFTVNSDTQITATSPTATSATTPVDVTVTTPLGTSSIVSADQFTYNMFNLSFNGFNQYVDFGNPAALQITGQITISVWVSVQNFPAAIIAKYNPAGAGYELWLNAGGSLAWTIVGPGPQGSELDDAIPFNVLTHVVVIWDGTNQQIYLNGALVNSIAPGGVTGILDSGNDFLIGADLTGAGGALANFLNGSIDAVRVYNTALSGAQVLEIYNSGNGLAIAGSAAANLVGWWKFDEGSGSTVIDSSVSGNNGTEINGPAYSGANILG
jgi:Concanavalin A-like lectin/glucanases superfamily/IPT/TIG domain